MAIPPIHSVRRAVTGATLRHRLAGSIFARLSPDLREHVASMVERRFEEITYRRLAARGFRPGGLIDVGAFQGGWTRVARSIFAQLPALMVEPQDKLIPTLQDYASAEQGVSLAHALLAADAGRTVAFNQMGTGSSMFAEASDAPRTVQSRQTATLDEVAERALSDARNLFVKVDVQGAELEVLRGGTRTLDRAALIQLETALLPYNAGAPLLPEVARWMAEREWFPIEVSGFSRPRDQLVQVDLLFAPEPSPLRPHFFNF